MKIKYQWSFVILWGCLIVGFILLLCRLLIGGVLVLVGGLQAAIFYRCPRCRASLFRYTAGLPYYCPKCGGELFEGKGP